MDRPDWIRRRLIVVGALCLLAVVAIVLTGEVTATSGSFTTPYSRQAATRDSSLLLKAAALVPGSTRLPKGDGGVLREADIRTAASDIADAHAWWSAPGSWRRVLAFLRAHPPAGAGEDSSGSGGSDGRETSAYVVFAWPAGHGGSSTRQVIETVTVRPGDTTFVRVDALVQWLMRRPRTDRVPGGVREIEVTLARPGHDPVLMRKVGDQHTITRIVAAVNLLPIVQSGAIACPMIAVDEPRVSFAFRASATGPELARASQSAGAREPTTACDPMSLIVHGEPQTPLLEGPSVIALAERLLGIDLH